MTTLMSPDGPAEVINARRTESLDAPSILKLVQPSTESLFGRVNIVNLIEKAVLAVTLSNEHDEVLGHSAFFDYPNLPDVDPAKWEEWLSSHYNSSHSKSLNTLFMHYFVAKPEYSRGCAQEIIRTMFNAVPELHYCFLVVPVGVFPEPALAGVFKPMTPLDGSKTPDNCSVFVCHRHDHVPVLHVRHARVEDHDDLVPIFNRQSDMLKQTYGDYFLAELIDAQGDDMKCIVAEVDGSAVGFMSLSTDVNVDLMNECFELGPFHGLRKPHPEDQIEPPKTPTPTPPPELETQRPASGRSDVSGSSVASSKSGSGTPVGGSKEKLSSQEASSGGEGRKGSASGGSAKGSRPSSKAGSVSGEDTKTKVKLSDSKLGESASSILSDKDDVESIKSAVSERNISKSTAPEGTAVTTMTPKPQSPRAKPVKRFVPTYRGPASVFCIQLFCIDERYEMRSMDFLPKAFELFSDYDYAIITVPHLVPEFPLLQGFVRPRRKNPYETLGDNSPNQKSLTRDDSDSCRITPRSPSTLSQELYIFSKPGLLRDFNVRTACSDDYPGVENLVNTLDLHDNLLSDLKQFNNARRDDDGTPIQAFVAESFNQIVGIGILRTEEDIEYIRSHYNIEDFIYYNHHRRTEHGHLHHYALNPIFKHYSKQFLKDILRLAHKTCMYYPLYPGYVDSDVVSQHSLVTALHEMVPVRARRQIEYPLDELGGNAPSDRVLKKQQTYALNHINRKLTLEPKVTINARVVVIGASDVGVAFLESFAFCPHLRFNNLTLISPRGLPGELPPDTRREQMMSSSYCYGQEDYDQLALRSWVNVVYGKMTSIDRKQKRVVVNGKTLVPYDHLILTTGTQYNIPAPTEADISRLLTNSEVPNSPDRRFTGPIPKNCFVVNDSYDAAVALHWSELNILNAPGNVVVYGNTLDAYTCLQALLDLGVAGNRIQLVQPPLNYETTCFNDSEVEKVVADALKEAGVEVYEEYLLAQWNDGKPCDVISSASFTSKTKPMKLDCIAFFSYYKKTVDYHAFKAMNDACLVYDGRLVIDANFHTNDVSIRAAGPLTKFQRSYHADRWTHSNFNSKGVGIQLATTMLSLFDPTLEPEPEPPQDLLKLIPMYRSPKIKSAVLPGGYTYLNVGKPGLNAPLETIMAQGEYGTVFVTGTPGGDPEYFRLHVNQYNSVETVTCISKKPFAANNLICLFGLHERFLNNLMSRYKEGLIKDLYSYFQETWAMAVFHDRFPDFRDEVRELLITRPAADIPALEEKVRQMIEEDLTLSKSQRKSLSEEFPESGAKRAVETRLLSFLSYNHYHLPMYAKPGMV